MPKVPVLIVALLSVAGLARAADDDVALVYLAKTRVQPGVEYPGEMLTSALCSELSKQPGLEVICASDLGPMLAFASQQSLLGQTSPVTANLEKRLSQVRFVIVATLERRGTDELALTVGVHDKDPASESVLVVAGPRRRALVEVAKTGSPGQLLDAAPRLARQVAAPLRPFPPPAALEGRGER